MTAPNIDDVVSAIRSRGLAANPLPPAGRVYIHGFGTDISAFVTISDNMADILAGKTLTVLSSDGLQSSEERAQRETQARASIMTKLSAH